MPGDPLRVGALYLSGLFIVLYVVIIAQFVWVCETHVERGPTGYVPLLELTSESCPPDVGANGPHPGFHSAHTSDK
jgi:hypothetical protein